MQAGIPARLVSTTKLVSAEATDPQASISPLGVIITSPATSDATEFLVDSLVITYTDGTAYTALDATTDNVTEEFQRDDGSAALLFNSPVDTDNLASITLGYRLDRSDVTRTVTLSPQ